MKLKIRMSNIAVAPRFHKPWALTFACNYEGTTTCPGCPTGLAALLTVLALPLWYSPKVSVTPSDSPPYCRAPAPFLFPCTVLLLILVLYVIVLGERDRYDRTKHASEPWLW